MVRYWLLCALILFSVVLAVPRAARSQSVLPRAGQSFTFGVMDGPYTFRDSASYLQETSLILTVVSAYTGCGIITSPSGYEQDFSFAPGAPTIINLPLNLIHLNDLGKTEKGLLVHTTEPVNLVLHDYIEYGGDATQILPDSALDTNYVNFGWGLWDDPSDGENNFTEFLVTATTDSTFVTITPSVRTLLNQADSVPFTVMLNRGECYIVKSDTSDHPSDPSLSGSTIHSTKPVSVISGLTCGYVPVAVQACNELMDELIGKKWWGSHFLVQPLDPNDSGGQIVLTNSVDFVANINGNSFNSTRGRLSMTFAGDIEIHTVDGSGHPLPVELHQLTRTYNDCDSGYGDPSLVGVLDTSYYTDTLLWNTPSFFFTHCVPIICPTADLGRATLDGTPLSSLGVTSKVINGGSYSAINPPVSAGEHKLISPDPVFAISAGFYEADAYTFIAGTAGTKSPEDSAKHVLLLQADSARTCSEFDVTASFATPIQTSEGVITLTISITYDPSILHLIAVLPLGILANASYTVDTSKAGTITITVLGTPLITGSNLFQLVFEAWKTAASTTVALNSGATTICADDTETLTGNAAIFPILPTTDTFRKQFLLTNSTAVLCQPLTLSLNTDSIIVPLDGLVISEIEVIFNPQNEQFGNLILGNLLKNKSYTENSQTPGDDKFFLTPPAAVAGGDSVLQLEFFPKMPNISDTIHVRVYYLECGDTLTRNISIAFAITNNRAFVAPSSLTFDSTVTCLSLDTIISILDSSCELLTLTSFSNSNPDWSVLSSNGLPLRFPNAILGYSTLPVLLQFHPSALGGELDTVTLNYTYFDSSFTRTIVLSGAGKASGTLQYPSALNFGNGSLCASLDSQITFTNLSCDTAVIDSLRVPPPFMLVSKLPIKLLPGAIANLRLQYSPHLIAEDTGTAIATLTIDDSLVRDTLTLTGTGSSSGTVQYSKTLQFAGTSICTPTDSVVIFTNKTCDTATIDSIIVSPPFVALGGLPISIGVGGSIKLPVRFAPETIASDTGRAIVMLTVNGLPVTDTVTFTGAGKTSGGVQYSRTLDFGTASICSRVDSQIIFRDTTCGSATIDSVNIAPPFMLVSQLPITLDSGESVGLHVRYAPDSISTETGPAIITLTVNGVKVLDTVNFSGTGTGGGGAYLLSTTQGDSIGFTRTECDPMDTVPFYLFNPGCDSLIFTSPFNILSDSAGAWTPVYVPTNGLAATDSVLISLVSNDTLAGVYTGLFQTSYLDSEGIERPFSLRIAETITPSPRTMAIDTTPINLGTIQPCQSRDTVIPYFNTSCIPVGVLGWNLSSWSSGYNVFGTGKHPPYPIIADSSDSLHITFDGSHTGLVYDTVIVFFGTDFDSMRRIPVQSFVPAIDTVNFLLSMPSQLSSGQIFAANILPDRAVIGKGLTSISGLLSWNEDDFDYDSMSAPANLTLASNPPYNANGKTKVAFEVSDAAGITLDPTQPIAQLWLRAMLTDTNNFAVALDSVMLNGGDTNYSQCTLTTNGIGTNASLSQACSDSLLMEGMSMKGLFFMDDPQPNPAGDQVTVRFINNYEQPISYQMIDELGNTRLRGVTGEDALTLDVSQLAEGVYFFRAMNPNGVSATGKVVIVR